MTGNKYSTQHKHAISIGGGLSSTIELPLEVIRRYGADNVEMFICALAGESPDLWRLVQWIEAKTNIKVTRVAWTPYQNDIYHGVRRNYWIDAPQWSWSDIWRAFDYAGIMGNSRIDPCSRILKRETAMQYLKDHYAPERTTIHFGIGYSEIDRMLAIRKRYAHSEGFSVEAVLADDEYLNSKPPAWHAMSTADKCEAVVGFKPFVYEWGASHNNCGGFCVKAGHAHMKRLLLNARETYLYHEGKEQEFRKRHPNATIMTYTQNGVKHPITLKQFREDIERQAPMFNLADTPACSFCDGA